MSVRAKFKVSSVETYEGGSGKVVMTPVTSGSEENKQFFHYTPAGSVNLSTINKDALAQFVPGKEFYVDFTPAQ